VAWPDSSPVSRSARAGTDPARTSRRGATLFQMIHVRGATRRGRPRAPFRNFIFCR